MILKSQLWPPFVHIHYGRQTNQTHKHFGTSKVLNKTTFLKLFYFFTICIRQNGTLNATENLLLLTRKDNSMKKTKKLFKKNSFNSRIKSNLWNWKISSSVVNFKALVKVYSKINLQKSYLRDFFKILNSSSFLVFSYFSEIFRLYSL